MTPQAARDRSPIFQVLLEASTGAFSVLVATGVFLLFFYQPSAAATWGDLTNTGSISQTIQVVHRWSSYLLIPLSLATAVVGLAQKEMAAGRRLGLLALPILTGVALLSGLLLPWQQAALWAVRVGTNEKGYGLVFDDQVKFFLGDQGVVSPGTMTWYLASHLVVSLIIAGVLVLTGNKRSADESL